MSKNRVLVEDPLQPYVGTFVLGNENVEVYGINGCGGCFYFMPDDCSPPRIKVGLDNEYNQTVEALLHEALEFSMDRLGTAYKLLGKTGNDSNGVCFHMSHAEFAEVCSRAYCFLTNVLTELKPVWSRWNAKKPAVKLVKTKKKEG